MQRILEPEVMDTPQEAREYDEMDFLAVNSDFAARAIATFPSTTAYGLDAGTGTARIPILICQERPHWQIVGIDLARSMLDRGRQNIAAAGLERRITLECVDSKQMPYADASFDFVLSNSLVHHLPDPLPFFQEIARVLKPPGAILIRDLLRPPSAENVEEIVEAVGPQYSPHQTQLFRDSLRAAFTLSEVEQLFERSRIEGVRIYQSSDRHWTAERTAIAL
ncbi:MAG: class I SAM-dependent methyltransferase [Cyanobacteriota bacterium]|nr:class I SAM-dependent methyltransferase [Cyanobacteriota bacterium]